MPQYFSNPEVGLPQEAQTYPPGPAGTGLSHAGDMTGAAAGISGTLTRHLLQNISPGLIGFPHALQSRASAAGAAGAGTAYCCGGGDGGGEKPGEAGGSGAGVGNRGAGAGDGVWYTGTETGTAGAGNGAPSAFAPQIPQNFSSGASGAPQERQLSPPAGGAGGTAAAGDSSIRDAPQERQNFCEAPTLLPHSGQNGMDNHVRVIVPAPLRVLLHGQLKKDQAFRERAASARAYFPAIARTLE